MIFPIFFTAKPLELWLAFLKGVSIYIFVSCGLRIGSTINSFMTLRKYFNFLGALLVLTGSLSAYGTSFQENVGRKSKSPAAIQDSLAWSVSFMKRVFNDTGEWYMSNESFQKTIKGVIDFNVDEPIDTVVVTLNRLLTNDTIPLIFNRKAENIPNKRTISGYLSSEELDRQVEYRRKTVTDSLRKTVIPVPESYLRDGLSKAPLIPAGDPLKMLSDMDRSCPASFNARFNRGWTNTKLPANVTAAEMDTLRVKLFVWTRQSYNDSILFYRRDSLINNFREKLTLQSAADAASQRKSFLLAKNRELLNNYNVAEVAKVNDSIRMALHFLTDRAANDSSLVTLADVSGTKTKIWTANHPMNSMRFFLKNEQNDSVSVILTNNGKGEIKMVIDDGVKFQRITETQKKEITFHPKKPDASLKKVNLRHMDPLPWTLLGAGAIGFSQTALSNWAKGGESSLSMLLTGKYIANYSKKSLKWENMAEFRIGIYESDSRGLEKNDDKLEFQSRAGYSAFKKWYYSVETDFRTQIARGYAYPDKVNPISAFMAPGYLTFSLGMDYKPNKNFSLFLSPFTSKTTFVRDTVLINPSHFGLEPGKKKLWEPGVIVKVNWHWRILDNINYDTRAEVFNNYNYPFQKFNVDWEQTLVLEVTQHISTRIMSQVIYDYNVKFPIKDANGVEIAQEAKWQFKEMFTVGFNYRF